MKKTIIIFAVAIATLFAFSSCQKEDIESNVTAENGVRVITAEFENTATKTALNEDGKTPEWEVGDVIRVLDGSNYKDVEIISGSGEPESGKAYIDGSGLKIGIPQTMTGTLYAVYPASATAMTSCSGSIAFTIPTVQDGIFASANICVAKEVDENKIVFRNATAVLKITTAADVVGVDVTAANKIAGPVTASFDGTSLSLTTSSLDKASVSAVCKSAPSDNVFYLATAPGGTGNTTVTCYKIDKQGSIDKGNKDLQRNVIYSMNLASMTINTGSDLTGKKGELNGHEYVIIKAKYDGTNDSYLKWATRNVGATADKGTDSYGTYFAWGDTKGQDAKTKTGTSPIANAFTDEFSWSNCPFAVTTDPKFEKYVQESQKSTYGKNGTFYDDKTTLEYEDDAARANWGGTWRMPIGYDETGAGEFKALKDATYWAWDGTDKGYYVFPPDGSHAAGTRVNSIPEGLNKGNALLFFPAAGYGNGTSLNCAGSDGTYWSSSLYSSPNNAYYLYFYSSNVYPQNCSSRYYGRSVRPVSD